MKGVEEGKLCNERETVRERIITSGGCEVAAASVNTRLGGLCGYEMWLWQGTSLPLLLKEIVYNSYLMSVTVYGSEVGI